MKYVEHPRVSRITVGLFHVLGSMNRLPNTMHIGQETVEHLTCITVCNVIPYRSELPRPFFFTILKGNSVCTGFGCVLTTE